MSMRTAFLELAPADLSNMTVTFLRPRWPLSCQSRRRSLVWKGSEQRCCGDSCTNTALSSHCHTPSPLAQAATMNLGAGDSLFFIALFFSFFFFCLHQIFALRHSVISVLRKKLLHDCSRLLVERRSLPVLRELSEPRRVCHSGNVASIRCPEA